MDIDSFENDFEFDDDCINEIDNVMVDLGDDDDDNGNDDDANEDDFDENKIRTKKIAGDNSEDLLKINVLNRKLPYRNDLERIRLILLRKIEADFFRKGILQNDAAIIEQLKWYVET